MIRFVFLCLLLAKSLLSFGVDNQTISAINQSDTVIYEIEDHYTIVHDVGTKSDIGLAYNAINSNGKAVTLYDSGDEIEVEYQISAAGNYQVRVWLRSGDVNGPERFWPNGYTFNSSESGSVTFTGNSTSTAGPYDAYGTSYWGMMEGEINHHTSGSKSLFIRSDRSWCAVDYIQIISSGQSTMPGSMVLHLPFNGHANDASGTGNDATVHGAPLTTDRNGNAGSAYEFDGSDDYMTIAQDPTLNVDHVTLAAWINLDSYKDDQRIITKETGDSWPYSSYSLLISDTDEQYLQFRIGIGSDRYMVTSPDVVSLNTWQHVAATYDGSALRLYINGEEVASESVSGVIADTDNPLYIGNSQFFDRVLDGKLDDVKVYNRALSATEVSGLYNVDPQDIPEAPSGLSASVNESQVDLTWTDHATNEDGFIIERSDNGSNYQYLDSLQANQTGYQDGSVAAGNTYAYRLQSYNATGVSNYSNADSVTIAVEPTGDLVVDLPFNGHASDASGMGNDATVHGAQLTTDRNGNAGSAYEFDGSDDYMTIAQDPTLNVDHVTLAAWINLDSYKDDQRIISKETGTTWPYSSYSLMVSDTDEQYLQFRIGIDTTRYMVTSPGVVPLHTWQHVAATYDGSTLRLYINGQEVATNAVTGVITDTNNPLYIGNSQFYDRGLDGKVDEVKVYNYALSATELLDLYNSSSTIPNAPSLTTNLINQDSVAINWTADDFGIDGFVLEKKVNDGNFNYLDSLESYAVSYIDTAVAQDNQYAYRIRAYNAAGASEYSEVDSVTIESPTSLQTPTDFLAYSINESSVKLQWTDVSSGQDAFEIHRDDNEDGVVDTVLSVPAGTVEIVDSLLVPNHTYSYKLRSINGSQYSEFSEPVDAITNGEGLVPDSVELQFLKELYQNMSNGYSWGNWPLLENWPSGSNNSEFGLWNGVYVEYGDIIRLSTFFNYAKGELPNSIGDLTNLKILFVPAEGEIPSQIGNAVNLEEIFLSKSIIGNLPITLKNLSNLKLLSIKSDFNLIPEWIGELHSLEELYFSNGDLSGFIPKSIGNLHNLKRLSITGTNVTGQIPVSINNLINLTELELWGNNLQGPFPDISNLTKLVSLEIYNNPIRDVFPSSILDLSELRNIQMNNIELFGNVPDSLQKLVNVDNIDLSGNNLSGGLPISIFELSKLDRLNINNNNYSFENLEPFFNGPGEHNFDYFTYSPQNTIDISDSIRIIEYASNDLPSLIGGQHTHHQWLKYNGTEWDTIPEATDSILVFESIQLADSGQYKCIATNDWVTDLTLETSVITVTVTENPEGVVADSVEYNALMDLYDSTDGPNWVRNTNWGNRDVSFSEWDKVTAVNGDVTELLLYENNLKGNIPASIKDLSALEVISLSNDSIYSLPSEISRLDNLIELEVMNIDGIIIPEEITELQNLKTLSIISCGLDSIPTNIGNLTKLEVLDLDNNLLTYLPESIGQLKSLKELWLYENNITKLPASIGGLDSLQQLWLYSNNITALPSEIGELGKLEQLWMYDNDISYIPISLINLNELDFAYLYDNVLTFDQIEKLYTVDGTLFNENLYYDPQRNIPINGQITGVENTSLTLSSNIGGQYTHYDWQKYDGSTWTSLGAPDDSLLVINNIQPADTGRYRCVATNDWVTDLTLYTETMHVDILQPTTYYAIASGSWSDPGIWSDKEGGTSIGTIPRPWDNVIINGYSLTVDTDSEVSKIVISNKSAEAILTISTGNFTVYGGIKLRRHPGSAHACRVDVAEAARLEVKKQNELAINQTEE